MELPITKRDARRLAIMVESRLINYKHYFLWADKLIMQSKDAPGWICNLATIKYCGDAVKAINTFVYSEPFEQLDQHEAVDEHVACLFLRYRRAELSWATFLEQAGALTDAANGRRFCEYFYEMLNKLEENEFSKRVEAKQVVEVEAEYQRAITAVQPVYETFSGYFREYVRAAAK
ncbi:MAG TPA: hypothetical protein VE988_19090 [Gemmataceae bacterium]|nr:hypothetical protein [Gemmataceae bacterium]